MTKTTSYPASVQERVDGGATVEEVEGRNGRRIFVVKSNAPLVTSPNIWVLAIDTDDDDAWVVGWGPDRESVTEIVRLAK